MAYFHYMLAIGLCTAVPSGLPKEKVSWVVQKSSRLQIQGRTNVNRFSCTVAEYAEPDTISFLSEGCRGTVRGIPLCGSLRINIGDFDCRNKMMTGEFRKTLQYRRYPQLKITFINLERMPAFNVQPETLKGLVTIELAGISKQVGMDYTSDREDATTVQLTGSRQLCFSDFGLQPPRKMGGLIKVNDSLDVQFILCLRRLDQ